MLEEHVFDLLPGYALGCLDDDELLKVARHLPYCAACRTELASYWPVVDQLALAAPARSLPPGLRAKIIQRVDPSAASAVKTAMVRPSAAPARPTRGLAELLRSLWARPVGLAFGVLALLLIVFMGISNLFLWRQVNELQARVPQDDMQLVRLVGTTNAPQAKGYLMVFRNEPYGTLVVENAPALDPGYQYQLWLIRDGKRANGGVFSVSEGGYGTLQVAANQPLDTYPSFGITIEPAGGSPGPTGEKVLGGDF